VVSIASSDELTVETLQALSAEASRVAGGARVECWEDDPKVAQMVAAANAG
jgi:hypothetical protein